MARDHGCRPAGWQGCQMRRAEQALAERERRLRRALGFDAAALAAATSLAAQSPQQGAS